MTALEVVVMVVAVFSGDEDVGDDDDVRGGGEDGKGDTDGSASADENRGGDDGIVKNGNECLGDVSCSSVLSCSKDNYKKSFPWDACK